MMQNRPFRLHLLIALLIFSSGCAATNAPSVSGGLIITLQPDPPTVFTGGLVDLYVDLDNRNVREIEDISYDVFETGLLKKAGGFEDTCTNRNELIEFMLPNELFSFSCPLVLDQDVVSSATSTVVTARTSYTAQLPAAQVVEMMTEDEYRRRVSIGSFEQKQSSYLYSDSNIEMEIMFNEPLPLIVRPGKDYFMEIKIRNIGNGFVGRIERKDFEVSAVKLESPEIHDCPALDERWSMEIVGKEFPSVTCKLLMPGGVSVVENYGLLVALRYRYEVRESATINIAR